MGEKLGFLIINYPADGFSTLIKKGSGEKLGF